jgi:hypothetical protein
MARRRRHWLRTGLATVCGLAFAGAVYGELVQPGMELLPPPEMVGFGGTSVQLLPGDYALTRLLDSGVEAVGASGLPGRLMLAAPGFLALDQVTRSESERREFFVAEPTGAGGAATAGFASASPRAKGGGVPWWLTGISKLGKFARINAAGHREVKTKYFVSQADEDNQGNQDGQGNQNQGNRGYTGSTGLLEVTVTPEPATVWLLAGGLIALALVGRMPRFRRIR